MCCTQFAGNTGRKNDAKNRHFGTIAQPCWAVGLSSQLKHCVHKRKNLLSSNTSSTRPRNMVNFGPLTADIGSGVPALLQISTGFVSWQRYCTALYWTSAKLCGVEQRAPPVFGRAAITWALAHILVNDLE